MQGGWQLYLQGISPGMSEERMAVRTVAMPGPATEAAWNGAGYRAFGAGCESEQLRHRRAGGNTWDV
jgi:hypothetical protein